MEININNKKFEKLNLIIFGIVFISFITVQDKSQFIMLGNCLYASFLIVIGIIIAKTIKLNPNGIDIFIGVIFTTTGILEVSFILNNLNTSSFQMNSIDGFFCWSIEILQLLGIYSSIYSNTKKLNVNNVFIKFIKILGVSLLGSIFITYILRKYIGILGLNITIENSITILTLVVCSRVRKKMKNTDKDNIERDLLSKITLLFVISRIIMLTLFMMKYIDSGYFFSRLIACMSIYYLYKYIVYTNIKKPYKELNHINKILEEKTMVLNNNNKRAMLEMKKTKILKDCLKVRDDKLKLTINSAMNPAVIFSYNKQIIYNNKSFYTQLSMNENYSVEEVLKLKFKTYKDILDNVDYVIENDEEIRRTIKSKDSKYYQVIFTPFIINKKRDGCLCIFIDNTKETKFEKEIISTNLCYKYFLESISDGIILLEGDKLIYSNNACKNIFKSELSQINLFIEEKMSMKEEKYLIDGKETYVEMIYSKYNKNKTSIVIRDITERKIAQKRLREREESYSSLIDILPDGICLLDKNLQIKYLNKSLLNMMNISEPYEVEKYKIREIIKLNADEELTLFKNLKKIVKDNSYMILLNKQIISNNKRNVDVEINLLPFSMYGDNKYVMFLIKDLTNKKNSELVEKVLSEKLETDKIKTEFFTNMSHELKTPLNVIFSSNQLLESFYKNGKISDYNENVNTHIELVKQNSYRLQRLINNIIDLTKLESGFYKLNLSEENIVVLVEDLFMKIDKYATKKDINLIFDTESEDINVFLDKVEIERVILNLLSNCIKFTSNNGKIYVNIYDKQDSVIISIKNTGMGIPKDKLNTIFDEFSQVDKTLSRNTEGSGIGLSIVKKLVELHNGEIHVKSEEYKETEFMITLKKEIPFNLRLTKNKSIYNIDEKIKIEFSDIYY